MRTHIGEREGNQTLWIEKSCQKISGSSLGWGCEHQIKIPSHRAEDRAHGCALARGRACPLSRARGARQPPPAEGWSEGGLPLMYELWLAIVSHPRSSCRQNKNLLWLIRKTGQLWIDCTQPAHGNINSNEAGWMWWTRCVYVRSQKKGSDLGGVSLNNVISALCLFVRSLPRIRSETLKLSFSCLI